MGYQKRKILVTGATGFIGKEVVKSLLAEDNSQTVSIAIRKNINYWDERVLIHTIKNLEPDLDWSSALRGVTTLVHCAARVHIMSDKSNNPLEDYRHVNVKGTINLARQAIQAGVKRFIFISSIKVNGENTNLGAPFTADDKPAPIDAYGISKYEAEKSLIEIASSSNMDLVIIRPTLVYGPGVKANFLSMINWVNSGIPLPLGSINNRRSLVSLDNLVHFILVCCSHPKAANQIFLVSDNEDISTTDLLKRIYRIAGKPNRLIPISPKLIKIIANIFGRKDIAERLCSNLQVDIKKSCLLLAWKPPYSVDESIKKVIESL